MAAGYFLISLLVWLAPLLFVALLVLGFLAISAVACRLQHPSQASESAVEETREPIRAHGFHVVAFRER
jgi:hypothetical protein